MNQTRRRIAESAGMLMIGDAVLGLAQPQRHCDLWRGGPEWWRSVVEWFADHPVYTRAFAAAELVGGLWFAIRQEPSQHTASAAAR